MATIKKLEIEKVKIPGFTRIDYKKILVATRGGPQTETVQVACEIAKLHKAELTAIYILEVPFALSFHTPLDASVEMAENILKRAEAIGREFNINIETKIIRSRSVAKTILDLLEEDKYDLLVLGSMIPESGAIARGVGSVAEEILREAPCRVHIACTREEFAH